jgi:RIO-like serine/threonine protein kinase
VNDFKSIRVIREGDNKVEVVHNPTSFPLLGRGKQGAVFKISLDKCVKIYADPEKALKESRAYKDTQGSPIIPKLYEVGNNYIVLEYIDGPDLEQFLEKKGTVTEDIAKKILSLLEEMRRLKFIRVDAKLSHIFITKEGEFQVIDHANSFKIKERPNRPETLMKDLKKLGLLSQFLEQVKKFDHQSYLEWRGSKRK